MTDAPDLDRATLTPRELQIARHADTTNGITDTDDSLSAVIMRDLGTAFARIVGAEPCPLCGEPERDHNPDTNTCPKQPTGRITGFPGFLNATRAATTCPTPCDDDCDTTCHETHAPTWRRDHQPDACPRETRP